MRILRKLRLYPSWTGYSPLHVIKRRGTFIITVFTDSPAALRTLKMRLTNLATLNCFHLQHKRRRNYIEEYDF